MSENLDLMLRAYEHFGRTGELYFERFSPDFVWDMSNFGGWPERETYPGIDGARSFLRDWREAWDELTIEPVEFHDAGDEIVAVMHQVGRSKTSGARAEMRFAQVWTVRDGQFTRMRMYADAAEALEAVGLPQGTNTP